jgi:hypothetical protein
MDDEAGIRRPEKPRSTPKSEREMMRPCCFNQTFTGRVNPAEGQNRFAFGWFAWLHGCLT